MKIGYEHLVAHAAQRLQEMGLSGIVHLGGGLKTWKDAGGPLLFWMDRASG